MRVGVFDSGLGGLLINQAINAYLPDLDTVYLGDTLHLPYGNRSKGAIYDYTLRAMQFLFEKQDCKLIILACNTASAAALRRLQQEYLPRHYPDRRILGVVVPTLEAAIEQEHRNLGLIATNYIVSSDIYAEELGKINSDIKIHQTATPLLVPLIENGGEEWLDSVLSRYLSPLFDARIENLILGCTHYVSLKAHIRTMCDIPVIAQDDIIPPKLLDYLGRHPEIEADLTRNAMREFYVSDVTENYTFAAQKLYGQNINTRKADLT